MYGARAMSRHNPTVALGTSYATWSPLDKGAGVTLSNGNRTVSISTTGSDGGSVRSTIGKSSGKWYWEVTVNTDSPGRSLPGVAGPTAPVAAVNNYSFDPAGYGYYVYTGNKYNNSAFSSYASSASAGDVIGVALDLDGGTLAYYKNGVSLGVAFTGLSGTFYAAEGNYTLNTTLSTTNFGASAFAYSVPSGFNAGLFAANQAWTTWNPGDKSANITLSNGNLSLTTTSPGGMVRAAASRSTGKWYWEVTRTGGVDLVVGVAKATASTATYLGGDASGYGYIASNGNKVNGASSTAYGSTYAVGVVIGVALDLDGGTLTFYRNGVSQGVAFTGLSGAFYPAEGTTNSSDACTANFGASPFNYPPPSGFNAGFY
jgi:hypothetical protein